MAAWRRKAQALLPELRERFADDEPLTPNLVLFAVLELVREAHGRADDDVLARAYAYAQWCHHQRAGSTLPNAAGVSFYEHLLDDWSLRCEVVPWLSPGVRRAVMPLWEHRLGRERAQELRRLLDEPAEERWRGLRAIAASA